MVLAIAILLLAQERAAAPAAGHDKAIPLEISAQDALLAGHGRCQRVEYVSEFEGSLHAWTRSGDAPGSPGELDLYLRVEDWTGSLLIEDEHGGGRLAPYAKLQVEPGSKCAFIVAGSTPEVLGKFELVLVAAPDSAQTLAAAEAAAKARAEIEKLRGPGSRQAARNLLEATLASLLSTPGADESEVVRLELRALRYVADALGDRRASETIWGQVLKSCERTLPPDHMDRLEALGCRGVTMHQKGDEVEAHRLFGLALDGFARVLPDEHPVVQMSRQNRVNTFMALGEVSEALELQAKVLHVYEKTLEPDALDLQWAKQCYARILTRLGDRAAARALQEDVLKVLSRTRPEDDDLLLEAQSELATSLREAGDLVQARALEERALAGYQRTLPADHPGIQSSKVRLGTTLHELGDLQGARIQIQQAVDTMSRTLRADHTLLQSARVNLGSLLHDLGELQAERTLLQRVIDSFSAATPPDDPNRVAAQYNLLTIRCEAGELQDGPEEFERMLAFLGPKLGREHPRVLSLRLAVAEALREAGQFARARAIQQEVLDSYLRMFTEEDARLQRLRAALAQTILAMAAGKPSESRGGKDWEQERRTCVELLTGACRGQLRATRTALLCGSAREAEARCIQLAKTLGPALSVAAGYGVCDPIPELDRESFVLSESTRGAALVAAAAGRMAIHSPEYAARRAALRKASDDLASHARTSGSSGTLQDLLTRRDQAERELAELTAGVPGRSAFAAELDLDALAAATEPGTALVGFRRYRRTRMEAGSARSIRSLCAFVLRRPEGKGPASLSVERVELGPVEAVERAVAAWRPAIGAGIERGRPVASASESPEEIARTKGQELRRLVLDPVLARIGASSRVIVAVDDVLHLVPLDALPLEPAKEPGGPELVGDRWRVETRSTLTELLDRTPPRTGANRLVALGGPAFESKPLELAAEEPEEPDPPAAAEVVATLLRGGPNEAGFEPLPGSAVEARELAALHARVFEERGASAVLDKRKASVEALRVLAPGARWLHVATHTWFAPESVSSWSDRGGQDEPSRGEWMQGMSPMLLCGLALAGANLPEDELARAPGLVTAEELSTMDLSNCELAVLSACESNVGVRRVGQGMHGLQMALQMAGARSVITSVWKVPDEATKDLMLEFYRRVWVEQQPKWRALWEAKKALRAARDERGQPKWTTRDWAAWVLTGAPD